MKGDEYQHPIREEHATQGLDGRVGAGLPQRTDGRLLFLRHMISGRREDAAGARIIIIVTTIRTFGTGHLQAISGRSSRRFAVIVDEAHGPQSGKSAQAVTDAPTREARSGEDVEDRIPAFRKAPGSAADHRLPRLHGDAARHHARTLRHDGARRQTRRLPSLLDAPGDRERHLRRCG